MSDLPQTYGVSLAMCVPQGTYGVLFKEASEVWRVQVPQILLQIMSGKGYSGKGSRFHQTR